MAYTVISNLSSITTVETVEEIQDVANIQSVDQVDDVANVQSVDLVDDVSSVDLVDDVSSVDQVDDVANVQSIDLVDDVANVQSVDQVDDVANIQSVDLVDAVQLVDTLNQVGDVANVQSVDQVDDVANVQSVDQVDDVANVQSVDLVDSVTDVANVQSVDAVDNVASVDQVDDVANVQSVDQVDDVANVQSVDLVDAVQLVDTLNQVGDVLNVQSLDQVDDVANVQSVDLVDELTTVQELKAIRSVISAGNSSTTPLGAGATFTGPVESVEDYATITVIVYSDQASAVDGFHAEYSSDGINFDDDDKSSIPAADGKFFTFAPEAAFFRIRYVNGATPQSEFRLQTIYHYTRTKPSSHRIQDTISTDDDAELVKAVLTGEDPAGIFRNAIVDSSGRLFVDARLASSEGLVVEFLQATGPTSDMNVDGSITPVVFSFVPGAEDVEIISLSIIAEDGNVVFGNKFIGITSALSNGILIETKTNDVTATFSNLQRTRDVASFASPGGFDLLAGTPVDYVRSFRQLPTGLTLKKAGTFSPDDFVRATVRDDLTSISHLRMRIVGVKR